MVQKGVIRTYVFFHVGCDCGLCFPRYVTSHQDTLFFTRDRVIINMRGKISAGKVVGFSPIIFVYVRIILVVPVHLSVNLIKNYTQLRVYCQ